MTRFSRVDGQGAGLKELRLTRELSLGGETRLYFGNGELIERETVVVGEQGREKFAAGRATGHKEPRGSRPKSSTAIISLTLSHRPQFPYRCRNNSSSSSSSSVRTHLVLSGRS